jgi:tRNA (mo5U34)-methyltransferase
MQARGDQGRRKEDSERAVRLRSEVAKIPFWYHCLDLGDGVVTPGCASTRWGESGDSIGMPRKLEGKSVLDVGAWDGFYSFEAERRGASRVLATDSYAWTSYQQNGKAGFELARRELHSGIEDMEIDVLDLSHDSVGRFDLVLFLGVLYHMRHPLLALERVASVCDDQLILETHVDMLDVDRPAMAFYPGTELNNDPTNWCGPNPAMVHALLRVAGFRRVKTFAGPFKLPTSTRMTFHAWK